jgi:hypothetical protein
MESSHGEQLQQLVAQLEQLMVLMSQRLQHADKVSVLLLQVV